MQVRNFQIEDYGEVISLWTRAGLELSPSDSREGLLQKLQRDPDLFLAAVSGTTIIGTIMGCYDGRRGWINHLTVLPSAQGQGVGAYLMHEVEQRLHQKGCPKVNLLIEPANAAVQSFYHRLGYQRDDLIFMEKWL